MDYNIKTAIIVYCVITIQTIVTVAFTLYKAKKSPGIYCVLSSQALIVLWMFYGIIENMVGFTEGLLTAIKFTIFPIDFLGSFWLIIALQYARTTKKIKKGLILLILFPPFFTYLIALINEYIYPIGILESIENQTANSLSILFKLNMFIVYLYITISMLIIIAESYREFRIKKWKFFGTVISVGLLVMINILTLLNLIKSPRFNLLLVSFSFFSLILSFVVFRYNLLDVVSYASDDIFHNTEEALFVLDKNNRIIKYNKAAIKEFSGFVVINDCSDIKDFFIHIRKYTSDTKCIDKILEYSISNKPETYNAQIDVLISTDISSKKNFIFYMKPIFDDNKKLIGKIVSFKNNTNYIQLSVECERSRISEDIHDSLSNMVNIISMNLEYAIKHFNKKEEALDCMNTAYSTSKGAMINLRRILEELTPFDIEKAGLLNALEQLFKKVTGAGVDLDFYYSDIDDSSISKKVHGYVIYKTCMEAINNAFFSGKAKKISIVLTNKNSLIKLYISDDGIGCETIKKGRGLTGIEKRIQSLGGKVEFGSPSEGGFNIRAEIPFDSSIER